jgi:hypothetical protein
MTMNNRERERRIDEALEETFPASDTPFFVRAGAPKPNRSVTENGRALEALRMFRPQHEKRSSGSRTQDARLRNAG